MNPVTYICPVCGYGGLFEAPWREESASDDICPSCGMQFGYHDAAGGDAARRQTIYREWRQKWVEQGMPWHAASAEPPPPNWDPCSN